MNSFGRIFRVHIFGESHGESVGVSIDGIPAGLSLTVDDFLEDIERRKGGKQKGTLPGKSLICPFLKAAFLMIKQPAPRSPSYSKIIIQDQQIMQNSVRYLVPGMQILLPVKSLADLKIIAVEVILAEGLRFAWWP